MSSCTLLSILQTGIVIGLGVFVGCLFLILKSTIQLIANWRYCKKRDLLKSYTLSYLAGPLSFLIYFSFTILVICNEYPNLTLKGRYLFDIFLLIILAWNYYRFGNFFEFEDNAEERLKNLGKKKTNNNEETVQ